MTPVYGINTGSCGKKLLRISESSDCFNFMIFDLFCIQRKFTRLAGCGLKSMPLIFKTEMLFY